MERVVSESYQEIVAEVEFIQVTEICEGNYLSSSYTPVVCRSRDLDDNEICEGARRYDGETVVTEEQAAEPVKTNERLGSEAREGAVG